ncbi:hypothetical protein GA0115255_113035, partial [Streptomyces sp. Ncost-T6T-2b]
MPGDPGGGDPEPFPQPGLGELEGEQGGLREGGVPPFGPRPPTIRPRKSSRPVSSAYTRAQDSSTSATTGKRAASWAPMPGWPPPCPLNRNTGAGSRTPSATPVVYASPAGAPDRNVSSPATGS